MTQTQELLGKIAALRQRLEQAQGLVQDAGATAALLEKVDVIGPLRSKVDAGTRQQFLLDGALQQLPNPSPPNGGAPLPTQLTTRANRLLRRANELLGQLRLIADDPLLTNTDAGPLTPLHRETVSMTEAVVRAVQVFPEAPSGQIRLCEGLEAVLGIVADRLLSLNGTLLQRRREWNRCNLLAELLAALGSGKRVDTKALIAIAESVQEDALDGAALHFPEVGCSDVSRHIAAHSLAVAQIIARLTREEAPWRNQPLGPIMAALIHDVGMLKIPAALLGQREPLTDEQRRQIESHAMLGADMATRLMPSEASYVEAACQHHERIDGTGYPGGMRDLQIKPLIRLLSVCDVYAAMCQPRAYRPAFDTRTALTDVLLLAEKGGLDCNHAERLLHLSFYPVGSVVELSDGAVGIVVATHQGRRDANTPARPVVALLTDSQGDMLPGPRHVDLSDVEGRGILRGLSAHEKRERLGRRYPELI
ncbi:MAG TPA: HD domain-containing phosphohydrolase [Gemmataceae bacterium]|nr:HD domain-containing phosphohydrolase [Gemmataceae bacterium]